MKTRSLTLPLAALSMLGPFATDSYLPALPGVGRQFGVSAEAAQMTLSVYLFCYAIMTLFAAASVGAAFAPEFGSVLDRQHSAHGKSARRRPLHRATNQQVGVRPRTRMHA